MAREISSEIIINSPSEKIWNELMNFDLYPDWNPFVKSISLLNKEEELEVGNKLAVHLHLVNQKKPMIFKPTIKSFQPNKQFSWLGHLYLPHIFDGRHTFELESLPDNKTKFIQKERFTGLLAFIIRFIKQDTQDSFNLMNKTLKDRVETSSP